MFGWIKAMLAPAPKAPQRIAQPHEQLSGGLRHRVWHSDDDIARAFGYSPPRQRQTTDQVQNGPIDRQFGEDLRATTVDVRSIDEWLARIAVLEWEYSMRVPRDLWITAHNDAIGTINLYRASLRNTVKRHQRRAARIYRTSRAASLA